MAFRAIVILVVLILLSACGVGNQAAPLPTQALVPSTDTPIPVPTPTTEEFSAPPGPVDLIATPTGIPIPAQVQVAVGDAISGLATHLNVSPNHIVLGVVEEITWPDESLECEAVQVLGDAPLVTGEPVDGFRIVLMYNNEIYVYHAGAQGYMKLCVSEDVDIAGEPVILDTLLHSLVDLSKRTLATRLDVPLRRVFLVEAGPVTWPDGSLGCPTSQEFEPTPVTGYRIVLRVGREDYVFHTNSRQAVFCPEENTPVVSTQETDEPVTQTAAP